MSAERGAGGAAPEGEAVVGVISDTHGLLRPEALDALRGSDRIVHAGDVGDPDILWRLEQIAPVHAVRGNTDRGPGLSDLPLTEVVEVAGRRIYLIHIIDDLDLDPAAGGFDGVVFGHTHRPEVRTEEGVLYLNPGSAGPRRFRLPVSVARMRVGPDGVHPEVVEL